MPKHAHHTSPLKWVGSKRWLAPLLTPLVKEVQPKVVCEPFSGSLAFSLYHQFDKVIVNDLNPFLMNFYKQIILGLTYDTSEHCISESHYYAVRERIREMTRDNNINSAEAAQLFYFVNKQGYRGLWRTNKSNLLNTPYGHYKKLAELKGADLLQKTIQNWDFVTGDYKNLDISASEFNFIDPPYLDNFCDYTAESFRLPEQLELIERMGDSDTPTVYCNSAKYPIAKACRKAGFDVYKIVAPRSIGSHNSKVKTTIELIAFKNFGKNRKFSCLVNSAKLWRINL